MNVVAVSCAAWGRQGCKPQCISGTMATMAPKQKSLQLPSSDKKQIVAWFPPNFLLQAEKSNIDLFQCTERDWERKSGYDENTMCLIITKPIGSLSFIIFELHKLSLNFANSCGEMLDI